jgi:proline iminopeptidase
MMLEQQLIEVEGATLEVGFAGSGEPVICQSHPFDPKTPDYGPAHGWESGMGRLVAIHPRGVGRSSGQEARDFTFSQHIDDLEAVRRRLDVDRWVFWGSSGGGAIGLLYALAYPRSLSGAIIEYVGASGSQIGRDECSILSPRYPEYAPDLAKDFGNDRHPAVLRDLRPSLAAAEWWRFWEDQWVLARGAELLIVCSDASRRIKASFEDFVTTFEVRDRLAEIQVPMLLVAGRRDDVVPIEHVERVHEGVPYAELAIFEESGHGIKPESVDFAKRQAAVRRFLATLPN